MGEVIYYVSLHPVILQKNFFFTVYLRCFSITEFFSHIFLSDLKATQWRQWSFYTQLFLLGVLAKQFRLKSSFFMHHLTDLKQDHILQRCFLALGTVSSISDTCMAEVLLEFIFGGFLIPSLQDKADVINVKK